MGRLGVRSARPALYYVNANDIAWTGGAGAETEQARAAAALYLQHCAACHRDDRAGAPPQIPSLVGIGERQTLAASRSAIIRKGAGACPAFPICSSATSVDGARRIPCDDAARRPATPTTPAERRTADASPYRFTGYHKFLDPDGYPAVAPPWGTLNAINLNTGEYAWKIPLGEYPELAAKGMKDTGSENYGGPIVTAGGLVFIAATNYDRKFRAFDKTTGALLWEATMPFSGNATPATLRGRAAGSSSSSPRAAEKDAETGLGRRVRRVRVAETLRTLELVSKPGGGSGPRTHDPTHLRRLIGGRPRHAVGFTFLMSDAFWIEVPVASVEGRC